MSAALEERYVIPYFSPHVSYPSDIVHQDTMVSLLIFFNCYKKIKARKPNLDALCYFITHEAIIIGVHDGYVGFKDCAPYISSEYLKPEYFHVENPPKTYDEMIKFVSSKSPLWIKHIESKYEAMINRSKFYFICYRLFAIGCLLSFIGFIALLALPHIPLLPLYLGMAALLVSALVCLMLALVSMDAGINEDYNMISTKTFRKLKSTLDTSKLQTELDELLNNSELSNLYTATLEKNDEFLQNMSTAPTPGCTAVPFK